LFGGDILYTKLKAADFPVIQEVAPGAKILYQ
jgi:hypothetical protein